MKIIDLLVKIANDSLEEGFEFKWFKEYYVYHKNQSRLEVFCKNHKHIFDGLDRLDVPLQFLNNEIEIIEEEKKIELPEKIFNIRKDGDDIICSTKSYSVLNLEDEINQIIAYLKYKEEESKK